MDVPVLERSPAAVTALGMVDCDIHPYPATAGELDPFLSERWRAHRAAFGARSRQGMAHTSNYPRMSPQVGMRRDAWPPERRHPRLRPRLHARAAAGPARHRRWGDAEPLVGRGPDERNLDFGAAMCTAVNDWQVDKWSDREPRLKGSIAVTDEDAEAAVAEIERRAGDRASCRSDPPRALEPLGRRRYWPILEACADQRLARRAASRRHRRAPVHRRRLAVVLPSRSIGPTCRAWRRWSPAWWWKACSSASPACAWCWWKAGSPGCRR